MPTSGKAWIVRQPELLPQRCAIAHFGCGASAVYTGPLIAIGRGIPGIPIEAIGNAKDAANDVEKVPHRGPSHSPASGSPRRSGARRL